MVRYQLRPPATSSSTTSAIQSFRGVSRSPQGRDLRGTVESQRPLKASRPVHHINRRRSSNWRERLFRKQRVESSNLSAASNMLSTFTRACSSDGTKSICLLSRGSQVRVLPGSPRLLSMRSSSGGPERRPHKPEVASSNLASATNFENAHRKFLPPRQRHGERTNAKCGTMNEKHLLCFIVLHSAFGVSPCFPAFRVVSLV